MGNVVLFAVTFALIGVNIWLSLKAFKDTALLHRWMYNPYQVHHRKQWYRMVSHAFIHGDYMHLGLNMFVLYSFGRNAEFLLMESHGLIVSKVLFLALYVGGIFFASLPAYGKHKDNPHYNSLGASGAVAAVVFAAVLLYPAGSIRFFLIPVDIPTYIFAPLYLMLEAYMAKRGGTGIAHDAHLWGALFGLLFVALIQPTAYVEFFEFVTNAIG